MELRVTDRLTDEEVDSALRDVVKHGLASQATVTLTGGVFMVGLALSLGASNTLIGLLAAITPLGQLLQIPSVYLIERVRRRQIICISAALASRLPWLAIALIPVAFSGAAARSVLVWGLVVNSAFAAMANAAWNPWMRDLVPEARLGTFFGRRMSLAMALGMVLSLAAGFYLDGWKEWFPGQETLGYAPLYVLGFLFGLVAVYYLFKIPEPRMVPPEGEPSVIQRLGEPFKDDNFRNLIHSLGWWSFAINLAAPFFTVYMLKRLGLNMSWVVALTVLSQAVNVLFLRVWGRVSDRLSHKSVLRVSGPLFVGCILAWTFTTMPERYVLTIPLIVIIHVLTGVSTAGVTLASSNIGLKLAPRGKATAYLAAISLVNSLAAGLAPIVGGGCVDFFAGRALSWTWTWTTPGRDFAVRTLDFQHWDFLFFLAFLLGLYSIHRLAKVEEVGEVEERVVVTELVAEMRRRMSNLSTVGGLRRMVQFPFATLKHPSGWEPEEPPPAAHAEPRPREPELPGPSDDRG